MDLITFTIIYLNIYYLSIILQYVFIARETSLDILPMTSKISFLSEPVFWILTIDWILSFGSSTYDLKLFIEIEEQFLWFYSSKNLILSSWLQYVFTQILPFSTGYSPIFWIYITLLNLIIKDFIIIIWVMNVQHVQCVRMPRSR